MLTTVLIPIRVRRRMATTIVVAVVMIRRRWVL